MGGTKGEEMNIENYTIKKIRVVFSVDNLYLQLIH